LDRQQCIVGNTGLEKCNRWLHHWADTWFVPPATTKCTQGFRLSETVKVSNLIVKN